jgi:hypothetical protein
MAKKYKKTQLLKVEIKSKALFKINQKGFITYFKGGNDELIIRDLRQLYPQYMKSEDKPVVNITPITDEQYEKDLETNRVNEKQQLVTSRENIMKLED